MRRSFNEIVSTSYILPRSRFSSCLAGEKMLNVESEAASASSNSSISPDRDHIHFVSILAFLFRLSATCHTLAGSQRIPFHENSFSSKYVLLPLIPFAAPNSTKYPFDLNSHSDKTNKSCLNSATDLL